MNGALSDRLTRGAVLSRFPNSVTVTATCATRHYGFKLSYQFDAEIDKGVDPHVRMDGIECVYRVCRSNWWM